ncbi:hypothetical protein [Algoriphagus sp. AK58]|uniref:hypothetical protein n=1 Tax=Algoriphagus sp. AK58 TaxID=1406877 RepID=UPI00164FDB6A|nr:hypothetical protein [Algoriphagus sp. AK58]MBC6366909.1 hypothetical protein [Algoriphagus sp. AK58]
MQVKTSPVFQIFLQQHQEAKTLFLDLGKEIKSKKAIQLLSHMEFLELYSDLLSKIHFEDKNFGQSLFSPLKKLKKSLKKIQHLKLVEKTIKQREESTGLKFESFKAYLGAQKRIMQKEAFDLVVGSSLKNWDDFLDRAHQASKGIKPLTISTAIHQLVQEELELATNDVKSPMSTQSFRDLFESFRKVIMLENILLHLGFNSIFIPQIHQELQTVKNGLKPWYANHLTFQTMTHFLSEKEDVSKKYLDWAKELKEEKKNLSTEIEKQAFELVRKVIS